MPQKQSVHVFGKTGCGSLLSILGIASQFSNFDVSETGTGMPCYCIAWNVSDKLNDAFFTSELEEVRSSHDIATATATHRIHSTLKQHGVILQEEYNGIDLKIAGENINHPFGVKFEDTVAFYMSDFVDPPYNLHRIITFFWYTFVQGGTRGGTLHPAQVVAGSKDILIPHWFTPTDITMEFVGIEGDVQFSKEMDVTLQIGRTVDTKTGLEVTAIEGNTSPCQVALAYETSNAVTVIKHIDQFGIGAKTTTVLTAPPPPPPPPPPPTDNVASIAINMSTNPTNPKGYIQFQALVVAKAGVSGVQLPVAWYVDGGKVTTSFTGPSDLPTQGVAYFSKSSWSAGQHQIYAIAGTVKSNVLTVVSTATP